MLFSRTLATTKKYFSELGIELVNGLRVLGLWVEASLCFHQHVNNVVNKLRKRVNALRLFKKIGLSIDHAIQFSTCAANSATYGLYWHSYISVSDWKRLEAAWTKLLKISTHEHCPRAAIPAKIRDLLGVRNFRSFSDYLFHLRTAGHHQKPRCERFTLNPAELSKHRSLTITPTAPTGTRPSTQRRSTEVEFKRTVEKAEKTLGTIKMHTVKIADAIEWTAASFELEKADLRAKYKIERQGAGPQVNLPKFELLNYLHTLYDQSKFKPKIN